MGIRVFNCSFDWVLASLYEVVNSVDLRVSDPVVVVVLRMENLMVLSLV